MVLGGWRAELLGQVWAGPDRWAWLADGLAGRSRVGPRRAAGPVGYGPVVGRVYGPGVGRISGQGVGLGSKSKRKG